MRASVPRGCQGTNFKSHQCDLSVKGYTHSCVCSSSEKNSAYLCLSSVINFAEAKYSLLYRRQTTRARALHASNGSRPDLVESPFLRSRGKPAKKLVVYIAHMFRPQHATCCLLHSSRDCHWSPLSASNALVGRQVVQLHNC